MADVLMAHTFAGERPRFIRARRPRASVVLRSRVGLLPDAACPARAYVRVMAILQTDLRSSLALTTVAEAMCPGVVMCGAEARLPAVARLMATHAIHAIVVPTAHGGRAHTITDLDLVRAALGDAPDPSAGDLAREPIDAIAFSASLEQATATMATLDVAHLLVGEADSERPVGMLSSFDIASVLSGRDPRLTRTIRPGPARPLVSATRLSATTVGEVMHPGVIVCLPHTPLRELAGRMADLRVHCVAVSGVGRLSDGDEHLIWGLVSDMDVVHAAHRDNLSATAGELAATAPLALPEDATLDRAATLMASHDVSHVVAVGRSGMPSGIVSTLDVIRILAAGP
jgi:CBS domain-containing protein